MALHRMRYIGVNTNTLVLNIKKFNYQKNIQFLSTTVISLSNTQNDKSSVGMFKKQIVDGCKLCFSELKMYISLRSALKSDKIGIEQFTKKEIECYIQVY
ncbi:Hypothetical protein SRAE_2000184600 [Strongyloides ratti]|uniref:Uncharacterized protein n=1 Tax=Strongyloides ratti TaxID=34506 RepID=A0A090LBQ7_STRRB|nr:Hypothetical protein SRAE_2000184600 [Strongyloides ratti]CEF67181.1 Hypothetical protein SRAE_2000184600 [Strongyloides ratti]